MRPRALRRVGTLFTAAFVLFLSLAALITVGALASGGRPVVKNVRPAGNEERAARASLGAMFAPPVGTITVNSTADTVANDGQCTLREAITSANTDTASGAAVGECVAGSGTDIISFTVTGTINLSSALPDISTSMTVQGPGASQLTVSGQNSVRVFNVTATGTVNISGLTVSNGSSFSQNGGGIHNGSATLSITNCTFNSNSATLGFGGAISNDSGTLSVTNCIFSNNSTQNRGAGIFNDTGALNVTGSTFTGGISGTGGGIYNGNLAAGTGTANVTNSTFSNNQSVFNSGGAIRNNGALNVTNSTFSGNSTGARGGALSNVNTTGQLMTVTNCTISGNSANLGGGGIEAAFGTTRIRNSIVALNTAVISPDILKTSATLTSLGHNVVGNTAGSGLTGAPQTGDYFDSAVTPFYLGPLQNNGGPTQTMIPGGVAVEGGDDCVLNQSCSSNNLSFNLTTDQRGFQRKLGGHVDIGAVEVIPVNTLADHDDTTCDSDCTLREAINVANANPGSTIGFSVTGTITLLTANGALPNISSNMAIVGIGADKLEVQGSQSGLGLRVFNVTGGTVTISGLTADNGGTATTGGGINNAGTLTLQDCAIGNASTGIGNLATTTGGGIFNSGTLTIIRCAITNNVATTGGGGISNTGTLTVEDSTIGGMNTTNTGNGGAILNNSGVNTASLINDTISENHADSGSGGGIFNIAGTFNVSNTIIAGNSASAGPDISGTFISQGHNLIGKSDTGLGFDSTGANGDNVGTSASPLDARLRPFLNYGGTTYSYMLKPASPAFNAGNNTAATSGGLTTDQRGTGFARIVNTTVDMGALETNYTIASTAGDSQTTLINTAFGTQLKATVKESGVVQAGIDVTFTAPSTGASGTFQGGGTSVTVSTDANGVATAPTFTANSVGGSYSVVASLNTSGLLTTTFSLVNSIATPTISGDTNGTGTQDQACPEQPLTLHANTTGATSYQWYSNGNIISGATSQTYQATSAATYTVTASANDYTTSQSAGYVVQDPTPHKAVVTPGGPTTFCDGGSVTLMSDSPTGIQWYKDGVAIPGANSQSYVATASGSYTAQLNALGCHSVISDAVTVTVNPIPPTPTITPAGPVTINAGDSAMLTSSSATDNQWYKNGSPITGATDQTYGATEAGDYTVVVTTSGCSSPASAATTVALAATLGNYPNTSVALGANTTVSPDAAPTNATSVSVSSTTNFKGTLTVNPATGAVRVTNASTSGVYTVTVKATNSVGVSTTRSFQLTVLAGTACAGASLFTNGTDVSAGSPVSVAVGDFNNDGKQDLAVANSGVKTISILIGDGAGGFTKTTDVSVGSSPSSVAIGDFNNDGKQDLAVANFSDSTVSIRLGDGAGGFTGTSDVFVGSSPYSVAVGDFNNDGKRDLAVANSADNTISILIGDGAGGFTTTTNVSVGNDPRSVAIGDFNNDGKQDLAVANQNSSTVSIRLGDGAGGFTGTTNLSVGTGPISVAVGDFNNDGKQDLAVANRYDNTISIRLGDGAGGFTGTTNLSVGINPFSIAVGDFNNDGKQDLAVANFSDSTASIRLGDGAGGFTGTTNVSVGSSPFSVAIGDFNGDGKQDLAVANFGDNNLSIRLGKCDLPPTITAATGLSRQQGSSASNSIIATVTDDGGNSNVTVTVNSLTSATVNGVTVSNIVNTNGTITADIVADCTASNASFTLQASDGNSTTTDTLNVTVTANTAPVLTYANPPAINVGGSLTINPATGPSDNGNVSSIAIQSKGTYTGTISVVNTTGVVSVSNAQPAGTHTITIRATDNCGTTTDATFTLDVRPLATLGNYPNTSVALGANMTVAPGAAPVNASSINVSTSTSFMGTLLVEPATGVVRVTDAGPAGTYTVTVRASNSLGVTTTKSFQLTVSAGTACADASIFTNGANVPVDAHPRSIAVGDFNGDGKQDLAVANETSNDVSILIGDGAGNFTGTTNVSVGSGPFSVAAGDFNGDGKQDLAVANHSDNNVSIRLGDGAGGFTGTTNVSVGFFPDSVAIGDFNGDGKQDLAVANESSNNVSILIGDGAGGFSGPTNVSVGLVPVSVAIGDFNNDGKQDLAVANRFDSTVSIRLGDGAGGFSGTTNVSVDNGPNSVAIGDFNGDGKQDLAVVNGADSKVSILTGDGAGGFTGAANVSVGTSPDSVAIGDFNNDGKQDLAVANSSDHNVSIRLGDGSGGFTGAANVSVGLSPASVAIGDFNGDGKQDLAVANNSDNTVSIRLGKCDPPPTITAATGLSRQQGSSASNSQIATVTDDSGNGNVAVTVNNSTSATVNGVTVSNIVNTNGTITADIIADCSASNANFTLQASDGTSTVTTSLSITVTANTAPTLTYGNQSVVFNSSTTINPATGPTDNGSVSSIAVQSKGTYTGTISVNSTTGVVSVSNATPAGIHTITIRATDNCGVTKDASFTLTVNKGSQTISVNTHAPSSATYSTQFTVAATSSSALPVTYSSSGSCTNSGATFTMTSGTGTCTVKYDQGGNANFNAATQVAENVTAQKAVTTTAVTSSANPSNLGQSVTFTVTVSSGAGTPTGTVQFKDGGTNLGAPQTLNASGMAQVTSSSLTAGSHNITADYSGDGNFANSTGTLAGGQTVSNQPLISFSTANYSVNESSGFIRIVVNRAGDPTVPVSVDYATDDSGAPVQCTTLNSGLASSRCDFTTAFGTLNFAANDTQKTFDIPINQDSYTEGPEMFTVNLTNLSSGASFATPATATVTINDSTPPPPPNAIDDTSTFVRQQYHDFLNREPDAAGLAFWVNNIDKCNDPANRAPGQTLAQCIEVGRINTSAAFFLSIEFQQTGNLVRSCYVAALNRPATNNMPAFIEFDRDTQAMQRGVIVDPNNNSWQAVLNANRDAFLRDFVTRAEFVGLYPTTDSPATYITKLYQHALGRGPTSTELQDGVNEFPNAATQATDPGGRGRALLRVTQAADFQSREINRSFVQMQYFGYLRRNPNDSPDADFSGYNFWLNKLNAAGGNYISSEMVKAFITSSEYRGRFGP